LWKEAAVYHPDIVHQLGQLREKQDRDAAARERAVHGANGLHSRSFARWLTLSLLVATPIVLWLAMGVLMR
jgi:hypothetical protein